MFAETFVFSYFLSDGQEISQSIKINASPNDNIDGEGYYKFTAPNGATYRVDYSTGPNGYRAKVRLQHSKDSSPVLPVLPKMSKIPEQLKPSSTKRPRPPRPHATKPQSEDGIGCALRNSLCGKK